MPDWHEWYRGYDDPTSSQSRRLEVVMECVRNALNLNPQARLLSLCSGDGRDTLPILEEFPQVRATLVELEPELAATARANARADVDVRTADAGTTASYRDVAPVDVLLVCGVFGNIYDQDVERTVNALPDLLRSDGVVIWTRGDRKLNDPSRVPGDPSERARMLFQARGFDELAFIRPDDARFRVGVARWTGTPGVAQPTPQRLFTFPSASN